MEKEKRRLRSRHVLLVEPYPDLRDLLYDLLVDAGCRVDAVMSGYEMAAAIAATRYDCVLLNIDQGRAIDFGLVLAAAASAAGSRIIMIADYKTDRATIAAKGWLQLRKPFTVDQVLAVLIQAIGPAGERAAVTRRAAAAQPPPASGIAPPT
jgi:DNA-binding NtrC family response regulator